MSPASPSVGRMIAGGLDAVPKQIRHDDTRTRHEAMARGMLDHVLRDRRARRQFARHVAGISGRAPAFRTTTRTTPDAYDLIGRAPSGAGPEFLGIKLVIDGDLGEERLHTLLGGLDHAPGSRLLLIVPRSRRSQVRKVEDPTGRMLMVTWAQLAKRLVQRDPESAELWTALAEFGENEAVEDAQQPIAPKVLLDEEVTNELRDHLRSMLLISRTLIHRSPRFSSSRSHPRAWLHAGGSNEDLGVEFDAVEDGSAIWLVGSRPQRTLPLGIGALDGDEEHEAANARLQEIAAAPDWRHDPDLTVDPSPFLGTPASRKVEDARSLLWEVLDPGRLEAAGFPLVPRQQPDMTEDRLSVRVHAPSIPRSGTFLVSIGGSSTWRTLLPRVTREFDNRTYVVQAKKSASVQEFVTDVHEALHSLATKP
ncbi:hypothetical protein DEO23_07125 [Brachybacterium endophyticum]|uniref:Uncharacterized protein n=1 Tax=Brachybacterium endophyticum TaxID=2182385 RepID=A0A2U2RLE6_9MICO|nr:hypothetical protein [Brachybacterium endophyticum]PWH06693.1 hypothetical protein DEO23_07125 [Brachybacterium endophyticum]